MSSRKAIWLVLGVALCAATACSKPERATYNKAWQSAVAAKDGAAVWRLLDSASRTRITNGLKRSQQAATTDVVWKALLAATCAPSDAAKPPEQLAQALIGASLADGIDLSDDGKTQHVHLEDGRWVASVEPIGFFDPQGVPLTLSLQLGSYTPPASALIALTIDVSPYDKWGVAQPAADQEADYTSTTQAVAEQLKLPAHYKRALQLVVQFFRPESYLKQFKGSPTGHEITQHSFYKVDPDGSVTPVLRTWDADRRSAAQEPQPRLGFGAWPAAKS